MLCARRAVQRKRTHTDSPTHTRRQKQTNRARTKKDTDRWTHTDTDTDTDTRDLCGVLPARLDSRCAVASSGPSSPASRKSRTCTRVHVSNSAVTSAHQTGRIRRCTPVTVCVCVCVCIVGTGKPGDGKAEEAAGGKALIRKGTDGGAGGQRRSHREARAILLRRLQARPISVRPRSFAGVLIVRARLGASEFVRR